MFSFIPLPVKIALIALILTGAFGYGYMKGSAKADAEIAAYAAKASELSAKLKEEHTQINDRVVTQYVDKVRTVVQKEVVYRDRVSNDVPQQYNLSTGWVYLHDQAASGLDAEKDKSADATPSDIKDNDALAVVVGNYSMCHQYKEQIDSLQNSLKLLLH